MIWKGDDSCLCKTPETRCRKDRQLPRRRSLTRFRDRERGDGPATIRGTMRATSRHPLHTGTANPVMKVKEKRRFIDVGNETKLPLISVSGSFFLFIFMKAEPVLSPHETKKLLCEKILHGLDDIAIAVESGHCDVCCGGSSEQEAISWAL